MRKGAVIQESGSGLVDALDVAGGLGRVFCDKCWGKLSPTALEALGNLLAAKEKSR